MIYDCNSSLGNHPYNMNKIEMIMIKTKLNVNYL